MASMSSNVVSRFLVLLFAAAAATSTAAFNITTMLEDQSDFSTFNSFLSQTKVADAINSRRTITVLAVDNGAAGSLSGRPDDVLKAILSVHVILDYFDAAKLKKNKTTELTTLYQASGSATNNAGFLNATVQNGNIMFGSMVAGSGLNAQLVKSVTAQPYNISVLQISALIIPQGIDNNNKSGPASPPPPPGAKAPSPADAPSGGKAPAPSKDGAPTPSSDSPPAESPAADAPAADAPAADGPAANDPGKSADGPDSAPADSSARRVVSFGGAVLGAAAVLVALA